MPITLKPLREQVVVITGASSGIGLATAEAAAKKGAKLVLASRSDGTLTDLANRIREGGGEAVAIHCDVSEQEQVRSLADAAISHFGRIDTWVNNAGLGMYGRLDETEIIDARHLFDINFWGVVYGSLIALPHLKRDGGALINVGSEVSDAYTPLLGVYTASKHAMKGFTDSLRVEVEVIDQAPVSITLIQPTAVDTPFPEHSRNYMDHEPKLPTPLIEPDQVAQAILKAAVRPTRSKRVGMKAVLNTTVAMLVPGFADTMSAREAGRMQYDERPRNASGILRQSSEAYGTAGRTHGAGGRTSP